MRLEDFVWTREPKHHVIDGDILKVTTAPNTDLWQRTYYHFRNDNAPVFQVETEEKYFSFIVKTSSCGRQGRRRQRCVYSEGLLRPRGYRSGRERSV